MMTQTKRPGVRKARFWRWAWLVVALVWPAFAHGCHAGDHDDELAVTVPRLERAEGDGASGAGAAGHEWTGLNKQAR
jgi:hypothetical protein